MEFLNILIHLDKYLLLVINQYQNFFYVILFIVIFCETGLVATPFLPGDSLLFLTGAFSANNILNLNILCIIIFFASLLGDNCNYFIGKYIGIKLFTDKSKVFNKQLLMKSHKFYDNYGQFTIIMARFVPIIRTFVPFVAGLATMNYKKFITYSICASFLWLLVLVGGGYLFGNIPFVQSHFSLVILTIIIISLLPSLKIIYNWLINKN